MCRKFSVVYIRQKVSKRVHKQRRIKMNNQTKVVTCSTCTFFTNGAKGLCGALPAKQSRDEADPGCLFYARTNGYNDLYNVLHNALYNALSSALFEMPSIL